MDWLEDIYLMKKIITTNVVESEERTITDQFVKYFKMIKVLKELEIENQLKLTHFPMKQITRPISCHLQKTYKKHLDKTLRSGSSTKCRGGLFASPVVITIRKKNSWKLYSAYENFQKSFVNMQQNILKMEKIYNENPQHQKTKEPI